MADNFIKQIMVGSTPYDVYDEYARRRLEGLTNVYSISCQHAGASTNTYVDYLSGETITYSTMAIANTSFNSATEDITITKTSGKTTYIVLESKTTAGAYYAVRFVDMNLGDTIYVVEQKVGEVSIPDRWLSSYVEDTSATFKVLDGKIDLKEYAKKTDAAKSGTYTTIQPTPTVTGEGGAQTATGTATVTYKKADAATGEAGGATITSTSAGAGTSANTGNAGGATIDFSNATFEGTAATITSTGSYKPEGTISKPNVNLTSTAATVVNSVPTITGGAGKHSHTVTVSGQITLEASEVTTATGTVTYTPEGTISEVSHPAHSHTVNLTTATITNNVTGTATGEAGAHTHSVSIDSHTHGANVSASNITAYTAPSLSAITFTANGTDTFTAPSIKTSSEASATDASPVINWSVTDNVLSLTNGVFNAGSFTQGSKATLTGGIFTAGTFTYSTVTAAGVGSAATLTATAAEAGAHTHSLTNSKLTYVSGATLSTAGEFTVTPTFTGTGVRLEAAGGQTSGSMSGTTSEVDDHTHSIAAAGTISINNVTAAALSATPTFTGTTATITVSALYTPEGDISGSQTLAAHSHSYTKPEAHTHDVTVAAHTHTVGSSDATATGSASVAVANHTHSMGHTHTVTIPAIA